MLENAMALPQRWSQRWLKMGNHSERLANLEALHGHGWPRNADNRRYFHLKPYGRVHSLRQG
jgi:hypothetical protein